MSLKSYLLSKSFWKNLLYAIAATVAVLLVTMFVIRIYTNHGESFAVPDFSGMKIEQVKELVKSKDLDFEIADSLYLPNAEPGSVVDQVPVKGFLVKEGRTIFLTICAVNPEQVAMPKLTDISYRQAMNLMQSFGLNVGELTYVPSEFPNLVLKQQINGEDIDEGILINKGSSIDLIIGENSVGEKTFVPNLIGVTLGQAKSVIAESYLNTGAVIFDDSCSTLEDSVSAKIWKQRPVAEDGMKVDQGSPIDLWLTVDQDLLDKVN
ncbi:PASTA domain-containing protein [Sunxiuqinia sp. A32]|uniref:PASTA domain-containing protein n=1 Tax=Sunxiuqinia sp. A32 TaxID=3461496 RepID=UPI0040461854